MTRRNARCTARRGFTLVEIMIVLAILVVIISLVVPRFLGSQKKADIRMAKIQIGALRAALESYAADVKSFPTTEQGLAALVEKPADSERYPETGRDPYLRRASQGPLGSRVSVPISADPFPIGYARTSGPWAPTAKTIRTTTFGWTRAARTAHRATAGRSGTSPAPVPTRNNSATSSRTSGSKTPGTTRSSRSSDRKSSNAPVRSSRRTDDGR